MNSLVIHTNREKATVQVTDKSTLAEIQTAFETLKANNIQTVEVSMPASSAADFMLIQVLSFLRKIDKSVSVSWKDHKPATFLVNLVQSLTKS